MDRCVAPDRDRVRGRDERRREPGGTVYVAELFGGQISVISHGHGKKLVSLPGALSVEWASRGVLYASTIAPTDDQGNPTGTGSVVRITLG